MTCLFPMSVQLNPPVVRPPVWVPGLRRSAVCPMRETWMAAAIPAEVAP
ncbi:MAG TPA: hypothetical protein VL285_11745 [Bryobacteraceae bacterium]|nr:hypothetical protein [Bryobacteraceae bacterium]